MSISRRDFIKTSGLALMAGAVLPRAGFAAVPAPRNFSHDVIAGWRDDAKSQGPGGGFVMRRASFNTNTVSDVPLPFEPHSFLLHPKDPARVWVVENFGGNACEIDCRENRIIRTLTVPEDKQLFMGHAFFTPDAARLCVTCMDAETGAGGLAIFDETNLSALGFHRATPGNLHQSMLLPDNTVYITSLGRREGKEKRAAEQLERSSLVRIDLDGKIVDKMTLESDEQSIGHFTVMKDATVIAVTRTVGGSSVAAGTTYISDKGKSPFREIDWPQDLRAQFKGSMLGVAVDEENRIAAVSIPPASLMMFLDTRDWSTLGHIRRTAKGVEFHAESGEFFCSGDDIFRVGDRKDADGEYALSAISDTRGFHNQHNLIVPRLGA